MTQGTTPSFILKFSKDLNFDDVEIFYITLQNKCNEITHNSDEECVTVDAENNRLLITLTQEETLSFKEGEADLQVRGKFLDTTAFATGVKKVPVNRALYQEVI